MGTRKLFVVADVVEASTVAEVVEARIVAEVVVG
jgi:hypothetical protein